MLTIEDIIVGDSRTVSILRRLGSPTKVSLQFLAKGGVPILVDQIRQTRSHGLLKTTASFPSGIVILASDNQRYKV